MLNELVVFEDADCRIPVAVDAWSKLTFEAVPYLMSVTVNSKTETSSVIESELSLAVDLRSWHLGATYIGKMDYFAFQELDGLAVEDTIASSPTGASAACTFPVSLLS